MLDIFTIKITDNCNFHCHYCNNHHNNISISKSILDSTLDYIVKISSNSPISITFSGGEPLLEKDLITHAISYIRNAHPSKSKITKYSITTNGTLLDELFLDFIYENKVSVLLSIDGNWEVFKNQRSDDYGLYMNILDYSRKILEKNIKCAARMTVIQNHCDKVSESVEYLIALGLKTIGVYLDMNNIWTDDDVQKLKCGTNGLNNIIFEEITKNNYINIDPIFKYIKKICGGETLYENSFCEAGKTSICINTKGEILPCLLFDNITTNRDRVVIGDITKGLHEGKQNIYNRMDKKYIWGCDIECSECSLNELCSGYCYYVNYLVHGSINLPPTYWRKTQEIFITIAKRAIDDIGMTRMQNYLADNL